MHHHHAPRLHAYGDACDNTAHTGCGSLGWWGFDCTSLQEVPIPQRSTYPVARAKFSGRGSWGCQKEAGIRPNI